MLNGVVTEVDNGHGKMVILGADGRHYTCTNPPLGAVEGTAVVIQQPLDIGVALNVEIDE